MTPASPEAMLQALDGADYLADDSVATAAFLAVGLGRPLLCEGDAGVGKTSLARALADVLSTPLIRLQCYEGLDAAQALYDWDFPRQLLHLRAAEAAGVADVERLESEVYDRRYLLARPLLRALETSRAGAPAVLLVDEVDRADDEFEAFLLEVLGESSITVPELGTIRAAAPPVVVLTSNRTRELSDALKRRCLYSWIDHPSYEREIAIVSRHLPGAAPRLTAEVTALVALLRDRVPAKPPGVAETIDWVRVLDALGARALDPRLAARTLGSVVKNREDVAEVAADLDDLVASAALRASAR